MVTIAARLSSLKWRTIFLPALVVVLAASSLAYVGLSLTVLKTSPPAAQTTSSKVCASFLTPTAVMGVPVRVTTTQQGAALVTMEDGYTFPVSQIGGLYMGKLSYFQLEEGKIVGYALVNDPNFNPCQGQQ